MNVVGITLLCIIVVMAIILLRALLGPTIYDRILSINTFGTSTVLLIALYGFLSGRPDFADIALVYSLINFVATIAILKLFTFDDLSHHGDSSE